MIRVIRVLEYQFNDNETAEEHIGRMQVPLNGVFFTTNMRVRSSGSVELADWWKKEPQQRDREYE